MNPNQKRLVQPHLPRLWRAFSRLVEIENNPDIDWIRLLELREKADPLTDDAFHRGYLAGAADALGISIPDILNVIRTKPRRRIIHINRPTGKTP